MKVNQIHIDQRGFLSLTRWTKEEVCWCPYAGVNYARRCNVQCPHFGSIEKNPFAEKELYPYMLSLTCGNTAHIQTPDVRNDYDD